MKISEQLQIGIMEITFDKVDGTRRVMKCTTNSEYIAKHTVQVENKTEVARKPKEGLLVVFDTEKNDWRSIRTDSILSSVEL